MELLDEKRRKRNPGDHILCYLIGNPVIQLGINEIQASW